MCTNYSKVFSGILRTTHAHKHLYNVLNSVQIIQFDYILNKNHLNTQVITQPLSV